ncbi:hypothetical protein WMY93_008087 [Mugilogobius chulae]|uniref:Uncharacterized protein n=1 Tax=Mugilogobius chulae TaxID=88201 RepID=A0AAW0PRF5_9GOBI
MCTNAATTSYDHTNSERLLFKKDKYTRVDLKRKRVDSVLPPYPRSIAKYWLGCETEQIPDNSRAEK